MSSEIKIDIREGFVTIPTRVSVYCWLETREDVEAAIAALEGIKNRLPRVTPEPSHD